jgi:hypothetical protein
MSAGNTDFGNWHDHVFIFSSVAFWPLRALTGETALLRCKD